MNIRKLLSKTKIETETSLISLPLIGKIIFEMRKNRLQSIPRQLNIEITSICNAKCIMCPRHEMERKMEIMPFDLFQKIVKQAKNLGVKYFALNGYGEIFTARHDYDQFIVHLRKEIPDASILINTNGSLMDAKAAQVLIEQRINTVHIDIDGAIKETFEKIRKNLKFEMVTENVKNLVKIRNEKGSRYPIVRVGILSQPINQHEVERHQREWSQIADFVGVDIVVSRGGSVDVNGGMVDKGHPCYLPWSEMNIWSDGGVVLCCDDWNAEEKMGNVRTNTIEQIWNSAKFQEYRGLHAQGRASEIKMCKNCTWARRGPKWFEKGFADRRARESLNQVDSVAELKTS